MVTNENSSYSKRLLHLISWGHWFTLYNIGAAILIAIIFLDAEGVPDTLIGKIYMLTNWVSHMAFLSFITFVLTVFPLTLLYPTTRFIRGAASVIFTVVLTVLVFDGFTYSQLGYHLNFSASSQIIGLLQDQLTNNSANFYALMVLTFAAILVFELVMSNYAWKHLRELQKKKAPKILIGAIIATFFVSHVIHIWADAKPDYSVLRQDTVLPLSYPATAKTLLTKYGLFNQQDYESKKNSTIKFIDTVPNYPTLDRQCLAQKYTGNSVFLVLNDKSLSAEQIKQFNHLSKVKGSKLDNYIDNGLIDDSWFNLMFSLPTIYQDEIVKQNAVPLLIQKIRQENLVSSLTLFNDVDQHVDLPSWLVGLFAKQSQYQDISSFVFAKKLNGFKTGLHVFYFSGQSDYQYELFVNAILLAQQEKTLEKRDIIWLSSLGNKTNKTYLQPKPTLLIWPGKSSRAISKLSSVMDIQTTLLKRLFGCETTMSSFSNGRDVYKIRDSRIFANTNENGLLVIKKDKNLVIDHQGNFESYSTQLDTLISEDSDIPMLIDGVNKINQFNIKNTPKEMEKK